MRRMGEIVISSTVESSSISSPVRRQPASSHQLARPGPSVGWTPLPSLAPVSRVRSFDRLWCMRVEFRLVLACDGVCVCGCVGCAGGSLDDDRTDTSRQSRASSSAVAAGNSGDNTARTSAEPTHEPTSTAAQAGDCRGAKRGKKGLAAGQQRRARSSGESSKTGRAIATGPWGSMDCLSARRTLLRWRANGAWPPCLLLVRCLECSDGALAGRLRLLCSCCMYRVVRSVRSRSPGCGQSGCHCRATVPDD